MKVLHIGKRGNMERFSAKDSLLYKTNRVDVNNGTPIDMILELGGDADFLIVDAITPVSSELITAMPNLKLIHSEGVAYNAIDLQAAAEKGIFVCNCKGMNAFAVAEQTLLLMVGMLRNVVNNDQAVREGSQIAAKGSYMAAGNLRELADCTIGLIGFGDIARATAGLLRAYGVVDILVYKPTPLSAEEEALCGVKWCELEQLLAESDIVSLHLPVNTNTKGLVNKAFLRSMKNGAMLVNTARGELVDDTALIDALSSGKLLMAGLDTLSNEPVQASHLLLNTSADVAEKLLFSPHIGGITASSFRRGYAMIWDDIQSVMDGNKPQRIVNNI